MGIMTVRGCRGLVVGVRHAIPVLLDAILFADSRPGCVGVFGYSAYQMFFLAGHSNAQAMAGVLA